MRWFGPTGSSGSRPQRRSPMPRSRVLIIAGVVIVAAVAIGGFYRLRPGPARRQRRGADPAERGARRRRLERDGCHRPVERPDGRRLDRRRGERHQRRIDRRRRRHVDGRHRQPGRLSRHASSWRTCRPRVDAVGRTDKVTGTITLTSSGSTTTLTAARPDRRHDIDQLGQVAARQPAAQRGPPDRHLPDRDVQADPAGRGPGRRA